MTPLIVLGGFAAAGMIGIVVPQAAAVQRALPYLGGVALAAFGLVAWRRAFLSVLVLICVEGFVRNLWDSPQILLAKDVILGAVYARLLIDWAVSPATRPQPQRSPILVPLLCFAGIVVAQAFNPHVQSPLQAIIGIRTWLYYIPCYFVARRFLTGAKTRDRLVLALILTSIPIGVVAGYQFIAGPAAYSGFGDAFQNATFVVGGQGGAATVYRPNATFAYSAHFAQYLALVTLLCLGSALSSRGRLRGLLVFVFGLLLALNVIEGQRTMLVILPLLMALIMLIMRRRLDMKAVLGAIFTAALMIGLVLAAQTGHLSVADRPLGLLSNQDNTVGSHVMTFFTQIGEAIAASPLGVGAGSTAIGTRYVNGNIPLLVEFAWAKVIGDLSLVGLALYGWLFLALMLDTGRRIRHHSGGDDLAARGLLAAAFGCQVVVAIVGYDVAVGAVLFWFICGLASASNLPVAWPQMSPTLEPVVPGTLRVLARR